MRIKGTDPWIFQSRHELHSQSILGVTQGGAERLDWKRNRWSYYSGLKVTLLTAHEVPPAMVKILCIAEEKVSGCGLCVAKANLAQDHLRRVSVRATAITLRCEKSTEQLSIRDCQ